FRRSGGDLRGEGFSACAQDGRHICRLRPLPLLQGCVSSVVTRYESLGDSRARVLPEGQRADVPKPSLYPLTPLPPLPRYPPSSDDPVSIVKDCGLTGCNRQLGGVKL